MPSTSPKHQAVLKEAQYPSSILERIECAITPQAQPIAEEHCRGHHRCFNRSIMAFYISHDYFQSIGKAYLNRAQEHLMANLERRLYAQVNAIPDARLEELWNAAAMDFVLNEIDARRQIGSGWALFAPAAEPMITFWARCVAPLPTCEEFPDATGLVAQLNQNSHAEWYEKKYNWTALRQEWLALAKWPQSS